MKKNTIKRNGVSASLRRVEKIKNGETYVSWVVDYRYLKNGERIRKQEWRADKAEAEQLQKDVCDNVASGEAQAIQLSNGDRMTFLRATEAAARVNMPIDTMCREHAELLTVLGGRASPMEAIRDWVKRNDTALPKAAVSTVVEELKVQIRADRKSQDRQRQISGVLDRFATDLQQQVHEITSDLVSRWLSGLPLAERSRRNFRDVVGYFCRYCVRRGYLPKGTDWLEGVQNYTARKLGEILIYTPDEMKDLLTKADKKLVPFLAIGAFAGLRHAEIARLDWSEVELDDEGGENHIEVKADKAKTGMRRMVPVSANLRAWLLPHKKKSGPVCPFESTTYQIKLLEESFGDVKVWKKNALRHSCISYRIAECGDVPRVSDESGNSVTVIRSNYLKRVKPSAAAEWFAIMPPRVKRGGRKLAP